MSTLNTDIYSMGAAVDDLKKEFIEEESKETLELGLYGFLSAQLAKQTTTVIRVAAETANEMFPTRARLESNVIAHAISSDITDINATPATMSVLFCIVEEDLNALFENQGSNSVVIDDNCVLEIGDYEYHLDYPIIISKKLLSNNKSVYTARYDISKPNRLSDIVNPYLPSPYLVKNGGFTYLYIACVLRQVIIYNIPNKLITASTIDNKTYEFTFENQLACFDVYIDEGDTTTRLTPVFEGTDTNNTELYCWYSYLDAKTIRVKFDSNSYMPGINAEVNTKIQTTLGSECNFEYNENVLATLEDTEDYNYLGIQIMIVPQTKSAGGVDRKTVSELRNLIPKESSSRGNLTNTTDLNNYFNKLNTENIKMNFQQKIDNQIMREYYAYILAKDANSDIIPTNTINVILKESDMESVVSNNDTMYICKQGFCIGYNKRNGYGVAVTDTSPGNLSRYDFVYTTPFKAVIDRSVPSMSYYMTVMDTSYKMYFSYINDEAPVQFICTNANWKRPYQGVMKDIYTMSLTMLQNIDSTNVIVEETDSLGNEIISGTVDLNGIDVSTDDNALIDLQDSSKLSEYVLNGTNSNLDGDVEVIFRSGKSSQEMNADITTVCNILIIAVCYKDNKPFRYFKSTLTGYDLDAHSYDNEIYFETNDIIDENGDIRISNGYAYTQDTIQYGYMNRNTTTDIYVLCRFYDENGNIAKYGRYDLDNIVREGIDDYTVTNKYTVVDGIDFFDNFSNIVSTVVTTTELNGEPAYKLSGVPAIKYLYANNETNLMNFIQQLKNQKKYIDNALVLLENQFSIDMKFYNTYGAAQLYTIDGVNKLDRVNVSFEFNISLRKASDDYTIEYIKRDIKKTIESLDETGDFHMPNLIATLFSTYSDSIYYIEFRGFNSYGTEYQHFYAATSVNIGEVPEFININQLEDGSPDITIKLL